MSAVLNLPDDVSPGHPNFTGDDHCGQDVCVCGSPNCVAPYNEDDAADDAADSAIDNEGFE